MRKGRLFSSLLALCLAFGLLPGFAIAAEPDESGNGAAIAVEGSAVIAKGGEQVTVEWTIENNPGLAVFEGELSYDASRLSIVKVEAGDALAGTTFDGNATDANPTFGGFTAEAPSKVNGSVVRVTFDTTKARNGTYKIDLMVKEACDGELNSLDIAVTSATVTVTDVEGAYLDDAVIAPIKNQVIQVVTLYGRDELAGDNGLMAQNGGWLSDEDILACVPVVPDFELTYDGTTLVEGEDYTVSVKNNTNIGTATVTFTGVNRFAGSSKETTFEIVGYLNAQAQEYGYHHWNIGDKQRAKWNEYGLESCTLDTVSDWQLPTDTTGQSGSQMAPHGYTTTTDADGKTVSAPIECNGDHLYDVSFPANGKFGMSLISGVKVNLVGGAMSLVSGQSDVNWLETHPYTFVGGPHFGEQTLVRIDGSDNLLSNENGSCTVYGSDDDGEEWECCGALIGGVQKFSMTSPSASSLIAVETNNTETRNTFIYSGSSMTEQVSDLLTAVSQSTTFAVTEESDLQYAMSDYIRSLLGIEDFTENASVEMKAPDNLSSIDWAVGAGFAARPGLMLSYSVSDEVWDKWQSLIDAGYFEDGFDRDPSTSKMVDIYVYPYDLGGLYSSDALPKLEFATAFSKVFNVQNASTYDDLPEGATLSIGEQAGEDGPFIVTLNHDGSSVDILDQIVALDAWDNDIMKDRVAKVGTDFNVVFQQQNANGAWCDVDPDAIADQGQYRFKLVGAAKPNPSKTNLTAAASYTVKALYGGETDWCEFTVTADTTALSAAIEKANTSAAAAFVPNNNKSVESLANGTHYWTQDAKDTFDAAILAAKEVLANTGASQQEVDDAAAALNKAIGAFEAEDATGATGYKVAVTSFDALKDAIGSANALKGSVVESANGKDVPNGKQWATAKNIDEFAGVIDAAQKAVDEATASQNEADALAEQVAAAKKAFGETIGTANPSKIDLQTSVGEAEKALSDAAESADGSDVANGAQWAPKADRDALAAAIKEAQDALDNDGLSQNDVDAAKQEIDDAVARFGDATKSATTDYGALSDLVDAALKDKAGVDVAGDAADVYLNQQWVTQDAVDALEAAISAAQSGLDNGTASQDDIDDLYAGLKDVRDAFDAAKRQGAKPLPVESVSVTFDTAYTSGTAQASAAVLPEGCETGIEWTSSDSGIASIDANGVITAHKDGVVTITATSTAAEVASDKVRTGSAQFAVIGMGEHATLADEGTGTVVEGAPSGTVLLVSDASDDLKTMLASNQACIGAYEIDLYATDANGNPVVQVQPDGSLTITLTVDEGFAGKAVTVYVYHSDDTTETINTVVSEDNTVTLTGIDKLSRFEVVASVEGAAAVDGSSNAIGGDSPNDGNQGAAANGSDEAALAATGDSTAGIAVCAIVSVLLALFCIVRISFAKEETRR